MLKKIKFRNLILFIILLFTIVNALIVTAISILLNVKNIIEVIAITSISTFISLLIVVWQFKKAAKKTLLNSLDFKDVL